MKTIGMIVAIRRELSAVHERFGEPKEVFYHGTMDVAFYETDNIRLYVAHCGAGEIGAAAATELLISYYGAELLVNFGVVGGLTPEMSVAKTAIVTRVVHTDYDTSPIDDVTPGQYAELPDMYIPTTASIVEVALEHYPELKPATIASADRFVEKTEDKQALHERFDADICDMESAGIALTAYRHGTPVVLIKAVSDGIGEGANAFGEAVKAVARIALSVALDIIDRLEETGKES